MLREGSSRSCSPELRLVGSPNLESPYELTLEFLTSKQTEELNVLRDQHAAIATVVADQRIKEIPVERAESIGASHNRSVDDWVVIRVGRHDTRSGAGKTISETSFARRWLRSSTISPPASFDETRTRS